MDTAADAGARGASGGDSASASSAPSEDDLGGGGSLAASGRGAQDVADALAQRAAHGGPGGRAHGGGAESSSGRGSGALGFFLKRTSQLEEPSSGASQFSAMFRDLKSDDSARQIMALTELSEYLSFSSEEALISFPMETFIPVLIGLLENPGHSDESAAQVMLLSCRCLFNVVDILPPTARIITAAGGLPVLCANLLNVEYIDVAELAVAIIEWISEDQPIQVLKAGGLQAILTFLDFFQISVQRQAANAAALMLLPVPPLDVLEQHVRPVLPTLATLLQHSDPQVLQSICECWRRVIDNTIAARARSRSGSLADGPPTSSIGRMVAKGKWRPNERGKKERGDEVPEPPSNSASAAAASSTAAPVPVAAVLEEMCPGSVLSNLIVLLGNGISSPSPHSSVVVAEVLYILAVLTNYSDTFTEEVLKQDVCALLRQMVLSMDLAKGGPSMSQTSSSVLRVLAAVASMLPAVRLTETACECEDRRAALFREKPAYLDMLGEAFSPLLLEIYEASVDPCVQSLCVTLLLAFFLASRERPELVRRSLDPTNLACFLSNLLLAGGSRSQTLACLLIVYELLDRHTAPYSLLFVRHGVVKAIHRLATRDDAPQSRPQRGSVRAPDQKVRVAGGPSAGGQPRRGYRSKTQLVEEAAHRVLSSYFASSSHTGESAILRALGKIAKQLRSSPNAVIAAHREALTKLHELLLAEEGITTFELTCSGTAGALNAFLYPTVGNGNGTSLPTTEWQEACADRLRLFIECLGKSPGGALGKLVKLCVAAVQRLEQQPLTLFPTHASLASGLPPHLRLHGPAPGRNDGRSEIPGSSRSGLGSNEWQPGSRMGRGSHDSGPGGSTLLSVLRLLAKPVRVRMAPHGAGAAGHHGPGDGPMPNFRSLLTPFSAKAGSPSASSSSSAAFAAAAAAAAAAVASGATSPSAASRASPSSLALGNWPSEAASSSSAAAAAAAAGSMASPAARLRNYLASKVSRKRAVPPAGLGGASSSGGADKRGGMAGLLAKGGSAAAAAAAAAAGGKPPSRQHPGEDPWGSGGSGHWDAEEDGPLGGPGDHHGGPGGGRGGPGERERDVLGEAMEAVLLVEPFAMVSALEDYIWEKHGPKGGGAGLSAGGGGASSSGLPTPTGDASGAVAAAGDPGERGGVPPSGSPPAAGEAGGAPPPGPRVRLSVKQPPRGLLRTTSGESDAAAAAAAADSQPPTPLAILEPGTPGGRLAAAVSKAAAEASEASTAVGSSGPGGAEVASAGGAAERPAKAGEAGAEAPARRRVRIYLNGKLLPSKTSVVQALVNNAGRLPRGPSIGGGRAATGAGQQAAEERGPPNDRFLACAEEGISGSDGELGGPTDGTLAGHGGPMGGGSHTSPRHFCGAIWGRVHAMTYELVTDETRTPREAASAPPTPVAAEASNPLEKLPAYVPTDFDSLVQCHARVASSLSCLETRQPPSGPPPGSAAEAALSFLTGPPPPAGEPQSGACAKDDGSGGAAEQEALVTMLQLICAFFNVAEFLRATYGPVGAGFPIPEEEQFHCGPLTAALLRQLSDPLAVCTGSVPPWCTKLAGACRFLFPASVRRILHHSCNLGLSRALLNVQQRALAQHAHTQETQRRLEGEVSVASIPRQKVRISRQRILESAIKVMNLYGSGSAILEVEYVGEVGTGSGPTLEFYAQVADILRTSEPQLFRTSVPGGMLFPAPRDPVWLQKGEDQAAQHIIERFRLLGQVVAKCILDGRLVDIQLHPFFWRLALHSAPFTARSLREVDPELFASMNRLKDMDPQAIASLAVDFTLPGHPNIELKPGGANIALTGANLEEYVNLVAEVSLVATVQPQIQAFCTAFKELLPLDACKIWSERELASIISGASVRDDACWTQEHLLAHIKAQHGYTSDSRCFRDLLAAMGEFSPEDRRSFLTFVTGAPSLPVGGFGGLKPPLTVVKKEAPPAPLTPDQFMPSVMTCANYLKMPEYSSAEVLRQKLGLAMREGQSAFLLS